MSTFGVEPTFRIVGGVPWVGAKSYPWAREVHEEECGGSFILFTENAWKITVTFGSDDPECWPPGMVAAVDAEACGLAEELIAWDEPGPWPHGTPWNWCLVRTYVRSHERLDDIITEAARRFSPTWPLRADLA